jgi:hypothetical protein
MKDEVDEEDWAEVATIGHGVLDGQNAYEGLDNGKITATVAPC